MLEAINGGVPNIRSAYQYSLWKEFLEPGVKVDHLALYFFMGNDLVDKQRRPQAFKLMGKPTIRSFLIVRGISWQLTNTRVY